MFFFVDLNILLKFWKINVIANSRGGLFAGATAGNGVGASASLAGDLNNPAGGSLGIGQAEAHAGGIQKEVIKTVSTNVVSDVSTVDVAPVDVAPVVVEQSAYPPQSDQTVVADNDQAVEIAEPDQPDNKYDQAVVVESEQSNIPIKTEQIEQSTQSVVVQTSLAPETTVNNPSGCYVVYLCGNLFLNKIYVYLCMENKMI